MSDLIKHIAGQSPLDPRELATPPVPEWVNSWKEAQAPLKLDSEQTRDEPGLRFDAGKPPIHVLPPQWLKDLAKAAAQHPDCRLDLIPPEVLVEIGVHFGRGAAKYGDHNWQKGMSWSRVYDPLMRHALSFWSGETYDPDPLMKTPHTVAIAWNAIALRWYEIHGAGNDDRRTEKSA